MNMAIRTINPMKAWEPLPEGQWNDIYARHLLRRIGYAATPQAVEDSLQRGLQGTLEFYFGQPLSMETPERIVHLKNSLPSLQEQLRKTEDPERRQEINQQIRRLHDQAYRQYGIEWLRWARNPARSPMEKWVQFLQDVFVVSRNGVYDTDILFQHQQLIRENALGSFPELTKKISRSPAMIRYLDLQRSSKGTPNENFARELFELFTLGEGNYTEQDIKEAARAFTGYRFSGSEFRFDNRRHDDGEKTIFGQTGRWKGDDVIDLVFTQPGAATFLPSEMLRFYLTDEKLPPTVLEVLGDRWQESGYNLKFLIHTVFSSRYFYAKPFRGNLIKSPTHFYLGLCQDLNLDVAPFPSRVLNLLRIMGQSFYEPPNVRGWVGGKLWINTTTLAARRQMVDQLFEPLDESKLNADDQIALDLARSSGRGNIVFDEKRIEPLSRENPEFVVDYICRYFLPLPADAHFQKPLIEHLRSNHHRTKALREILIAILQSPQYQLC